MEEKGGGKWALALGVTSPQQAQPPLPAGAPSRASPLDLPSELAMVTPLARNDGVVGTWSEQELLLWGA